MLPTLAILAILAPMSFAQDADPTEVTEPTCDSALLLTEFEESAPATRARAWNDLNACDTALGQENIGAALDAMITGPEANKAVVTFIENGETAAVTSWLEGLVSREKNSVIGFLGEQCKDSAPVADYFVSERAAKGEAFFKERWHRGLSDCRTENIRVLLSNEIGVRSEGQVTDQTAFFSVLEVYARNHGALAIPTLTALGNTQTNDEVLSYIINAFADAANVGSEQGMDLETADLAIAAIVELGPILPERAVMQARTTLTTLDAEKEADRLAKYRWSDRLKDGVYSYGVVAVEEMVCKNGKKSAYLHHATISEAGNLWPETIDEMLLEKLSFEWSLDHASRCKGEGEVIITFTKEPFTDRKAEKAWFADQFKAFKDSRSEYKKARIVEQRDFSI